MKDASRSRIDPRAGYVNVAKVTACRECGGPLPPRRTFCSAPCVHAWKLRTQPTYAARHVLERDHGVCAECQLDCVALQVELAALLRDQRKASGNDWDPPWRRPRPITHELKVGVYAGRVLELGLTGSRAALQRRLWEMDHVVPVAEGGGSCGLENLRTLCWRCHAKVTGELRRRLNAAKRAAAAEQPCATNAEPTP